jgi:hypothetical protein
MLSRSLGAGATRVIMRTEVEMGSDRKDRVGEGLRFRSVCGAARPESEGGRIVSQSAQCLHCRRMIQTGCIRPFYQQEATRDPCSVLALSAAWKV